MKSEEKVQAVFHFHQAAWCVPSSYYSSPTIGHWQSEHREDHCAMSCELSAKCQAFTWVPLSDEQEAERIKTGTTTHAQCFLSDQCPEAELLTEDILGRHVALTRTSLQCCIDIMANRNRPRMNLL